MSDYYLRRLFSIHKKLRFNGDILRELPEQLMALKHIEPNDSVLELGGSIGRNSCVINYILTKKENHVVIEPSKKELKILLDNRNRNNLKFSIENSAISNIQLYSKGWSTFDIQVPDSVPVNIISYSELKRKYNINFTAIIIDCEGNFTKILQSFPDILDNIRLLIIEHDFNTQEDINYFYSEMNNNGFVLSDKFLKREKYGPGNNWSDGVIGDPIFVSVWKK